MGIISCASGSSCWRGLDYYKLKKVKNIKKINNFEYTAVVEGNNKYNVYLNLEHVKKSKCNCPLAVGKSIICKHIVATYFEAVPNSAKAFEKEQEKYEKEYQKYKENEYKNAIKFLNTMTKKELADELTYIFNYAPSWIYEDFVRNHRISGYN